MEEVVLLSGGYTFVSPYLFVYGTLRVGGGNYKKYHLHSTKHLGTYRLLGWKLHSIFATYTGREEDYVVVDVFDFSKLEVVKMYELNYHIDRLEGVMNHSYVPTIIPFSLESEKKVYSGLAKMYHAPLKGNPGRENEKDFISPDADHTQYPIIEAPLFDFNNENENED